MVARLCEIADPASIRIPGEPLRAVFTPDVLRTWSVVSKPSDALVHRLNVLNASGPSPADAEKSYSMKRRRAIRAAWEVYLEASFACGMFEGERGTELRARLIGIDDDGFRSAIAECMTCWFLAGRMRFQVHGLAQGRGAKMLDMLAVLPDGEAGVEVKAPFRERPVGTTSWFGNDAGKIRQCLETAEKQLSKDTPNIVVIAPSLRTPMFADRRVLVQAIYGESVIVLDYNTEKGRMENERLEFSPRGKFLNRKRPDGKLLKPDGFPAYQRVSAVLCIEEHIRETHPFPADECVLASIADRERGELIRLVEKKRKLYCGGANQLWMEHNVLLLHNPYSYHAISEELWSEFPQLVPRGDHMEWTDGVVHPV